MRKKFLAFTLCFALVALLLAGCGGNSSSTPDTPSRPSGGAGASSPARTQSLRINVINDSPFTIYNLYVSPTASDNWGDDHLGDSDILSEEDSYRIEVDSYDYENYDVLLVDSEDNKYTFEYVPLFNNTEIVIAYEPDGLALLLTYSDGGSGHVAATEGGSNSPAPTTGTGYDTNGRYEFTLYNESSYDIYAIYIGIANASSEHDIDILPAILPADDYYDASGQASQGDWMNTEWTLYVEDVDGDVSASFDVFNPWTVSYVNITWEGNGYVCEFVY